jgi:NitT/TauT family transport system substrate-binding protein
VGGTLRPFLRVVLVGFVVGSTPAAAADSVTLRLNGPFGGVHAPFFLGLERGYYTQEGIELSIDEGRGPGRSVQLVAAKEATFGVSDAGNLILGVAKGAPLKAIMTVISTADYAVVSPADSGIKTAKDLEGKRIAITVGEAAAQLFPAILAANGVNREKLILVQVDPDQRVAAVAERRADALLGSLTQHAFQIQALGVASSELSYASLGVSSVGLTLHAHNDTLRDKPDLVKRFVRATVRAWEATQEAPRQAVESLRKMFPELDSELLINQIRAVMSLRESMNTRGRGFGFSAELDWALTLDLVKTYRDLKTELAATAFFTNEFLP